MKVTLRILLVAFLLVPFSYAIAQTDCPDAIIVCGNANYTGLNATGIGVQEIDFNNACSSQEHNSLWLKILIKDGGTLGFILTPESDNLVVDFDFWIYGPNATCGALGTAIRCSTTNPGAAGLTFNDTGMNGTETDVSEGPGPDGNAYIRWMDVNDDDIYYLVIDRPHGEANFSIEWTGTATFHSIPEFLNPDNIALEIMECDDDGVTDGFTTFDLTVFEEMFIGPQTDVEITYHTDSNGMLTGDDPLENPGAYLNTANPQTIYMRMTNPVTGCYSTQTMDIWVNTSFPTGVPANISLCDLDGTGIREFNLIQTAAPISNGFENTEVVYYASFNDAQNENSPLPNLYQNQVPYTLETIWARVETTSGCYRFAFVPFTITVFPNPEMMHSDEFPEGMPLEITECDENWDNATAFDLTVYEPMLTGTQTGMQFTYHTSADNAEIGSNSIAGPLSYVNTSNPQTVYIRMSNPITGCYVFEPLTLRIDYSMPVGEPEKLELCDLDGDGVGEFDLSLNTEAIANDFPDTTVTYYSSAEDAQNKVNMLPVPYQNQAADSTQTIWARLETTQGCYRYGITSFDIEIYPLPQMMRNPDFPPEAPLEINSCDDDGIDDGFTDFDLTQYEGMLTGTQTGVALTYYTDYNDALNGVNDIDIPESYVNVSNPQTVFMRMTSTATGCFVIESLTLKVDTDLPTGTPMPLSLCDEDGDGFAVFALTQNDNAIRNGQANTSVAYYASQQDAEDEINPLPANYQNLQPNVPQTLWARLESTDACFRYGITSFAIGVNPLPQPMRSNEFPIGTPLEIAQCDDDGTHDAITDFDLSVFEEMLTGTQTGISITYHTDPADLALGGNAIDNPEAFINTANPQTVYIRMAYSATGCYVTDSVVLSIDYSLPTGEPENMELCDTERNGIRQFDLAQNDEYIKNGNNNSVVTYYASEQDAIDEINPLSNLYENQQPYLTETVWARLENISGCYGYGITSFTIGVLSIPEITYTTEITDFTAYSNSIAVMMASADVANYEFSLDGRTFSDATFFDGLVPGVYTLYIQSKDGCSSVTEQIPILNYPKFFTPNGDGINEVWNVVFIYFFPDAIVNIFDRYGKLIKSYRGKEPGWDGTYNGERLPSTDYWFEIVFANGRKIKGHFAMVR
ncbi:T9SS type B sorting domain-containing protein [Flavobacterium sp. MFBS3-15]|uniref:T9SS type B sorting domain-containing protein n=1 Tax=Flavobacterium sp. MFBS3-15 TaxID=2989816 RepID=UPI0022359DA5|nr:T9SS type B sorting domain-containing protein [Flavobacterium sp. MFBS3-15]MCW4468386.1 T9SS type B sorting domain-containing protein [Flavobacterium sp. MFBS3-15]